MTGPQLRALRLSLGLTVAQAAILCGWNSAEYADTENGKGGFNDWCVEHCMNALNEWQAASDKNDGGIDIGQYYPGGIN